MTDDFIGDVAGAAGIDAGRLRDDAQGLGPERELARIEAEALRLGLEGTPAFVVRGPRGRVSFPASRAPSR